MYGIFFLIQSLYIFTFFLCRINIRIELAVKFIFKLNQLANKIVLLCSPNDKIKQISINEIKINTNRSYKN